LYFWPAPRTYTGQPLAELHTVSSPPLVERLVADLLAAGARPARPGEFTLRAFLAGKKDLTQAEAVLGVIEARTDADLHAALSQLAGGVTRPLDRLRDDLLNLLADVEAGLDFADEGIEFVAKPDLLAQVGVGVSQLDALARQLDDRGVSGRPVRAALVGDPNAGKSSLFNALAGRGAAIVSPVPGTTRDYLTATVVLDGVPVELIDTAGWQDASDSVEEQAQRLGREQADRADVLVWCVPVGEAFDPAAAARLAATGATVLRVRTKDDAGAEPPVSCSAVTPGGTDGVRRALAEAAAGVARPALAPSLSRCRHHVAAAADHLRAAAAHAGADDPPELVASALRAALDQVGELTGAVVTDDLLDRVFSRFCIGK
jgi:tRNA modification GTPase